MKNQSPLKRDKIKKISKLLTSRMLYLCLGLFFALSIFVANAAWNSTVSTGDGLTDVLWNDVVDKLDEINNRVGTLESGVNQVLSSNDSAVTGTARCASVGKKCLFQYRKRHECNWGDHNGNDGTVLFMVPCGDSGHSNHGDCGGLACSGGCTYFTQSVTCF